MITVYLSDNQLQVVTGSGGGRIAISRNVVLDGLGDCIYSGAVTNREEFTRRVKPFFEQNGLLGKSVGLVLSSGQIVTRIIKVPAGNEKNTQTYIANQLSDMDRMEDAVYSCSVLSQDRKTRLNQVLAVMASRKFLDEQIGLLAACGVTVLSVRPALDCVLRVLTGKTLTGNTCIVQIRETGGFRDYLFVDGLYAYSGFHRLFTEPGSPDVGLEIARAVSNVIQFTQAQRINCRLETVFLGGFDQTDTDAANQTIPAMNPGLAVRPLVLPDKIVIGAENADMAGCLYAAGDMLANRRDCNLLGKKEKVHSIGKTARTLLICFLSLALVLSGVIGGLHWGRADLRQQLTKSQNYINDETVQKSVAYSENLLAAQQAVNRHRQALETMRETLLSYPLPSSAVNDLLDICADGLVTVQVMQYNSQTGVLTFSNEAEMPEDIPPFIQRLREQEWLTVQSYSGYEYIERRDAYVFSVVIRLTAYAGREAVQ